MHAFQRIKRSLQQGKLSTIASNAGQFLAALSLLGMFFLFVSPLHAAHDTPPAREAWYLVRQRCYLCHYIDHPGFKFAPSLSDLFKDPNAKLPNGKPVNDETVSAWIADGAPGMPAFKYTLNQKQIQLIITYLKGGFPTAPRQDGTYAQAPTN